ncbi:hypothetical protein OGZ37_06855 [Lactococcus lactis]|uniref:hypothetical protein n=1 Tax=Lactococcus lactis TaxID=1358 RepID=UPI0024181932|nr:hypothetical protein [Lactococcus lactis]MDG4966295.1 hypothetical protein [Lactococcus lactis]
MEKEKYNKEKIRQLNILVTNLLFLVIPTAAYYVYEIKFFLFMSIVCGAYSAIRLIAFPIWCKKNKPLT